MQRVPTSLLTGVLVFVCSYVLFRQFDVLEAIVEYSAAYENYEIDEIIAAMIMLSFYLLWFSFKKTEQATRAQVELTTTNLSLKQALNEIKVLRGILPICSHCKKIRTDEGKWVQIEKFISERSDATFSHSLCEECLKKHYPKEAKKIIRES